MNISNKTKTIMAEMYLVKMMIHDYMLATCNNNNSRGPSTKPRGTSWLCAIQALSLCLYLLIDISCFQLLSNWLFDAWVACNVQSLIFIDIE